MLKPDSTFPSSASATLANKVSSEKPSYSLWVIDAFAFIAQRERLEGSIDPVDLPRLNEAASQDIASPFHARVLGGTSPRGHPALHFEVQGELTLICQRCLQEMPWRMQIKTNLELVRSEKALDTDDSLPDNWDMIVGHPELDIRSVIEDELLLHIPYSPRHTACDLPADVLQLSERVEKAESPFAILASLHSKK